MPRAAHQRNENCTAETQRTPSFFRIFLCVPRAFAVNLLLTAENGWLLAIFTGVRHAACGTPKG